MSVTKRRQCRAPRGTGGWPLLCGSRGSEAQVEHLAVEVTAEQLSGSGEGCWRHSRQVAIDDPLIIADQAFGVLRQAHELEASRVQSLLLRRDV